MSDDDQDWRLKVELAETVETGGTLDHLLGRLRAGGGGGAIGGGGRAGAEKAGKTDLVHELGTAVPDDVVLTHDGKLLFAYAADEATLTATRSAIEGVLAREHVQGTVFVSHWDDEDDVWRQTDPPPTAGERRAQEISERDAETVQTRTMVASSGKMIRAEFEQSMVEFAEKLGIKCTIMEHPHLLTTQIGFTVTGPKRKLDEFSKGLRAEEAMTIRTEGVVMLSPL